MNQFVILDLKFLLKGEIQASKFYNSLHLCTALCRLTLTLRSNGGARLLQAGCRWRKEVYQGQRAEPTFLGPVHCAVNAAAQEQLARLPAALAQFDEEGPFLHKSVWFVPRSNINSLGQFYFSDSCKNKKQVLSCLLKRSCVYDALPYFEACFASFVHIVYLFCQPSYISIRYRPRFFDQVGHQTMSACIENKHFFTKSCHQTYQNYEQPPQSLQNLYFQSHFSASKINRIFLIFFL